jgi:hypothetical protein
MVTLDVTTNLLKVVRGLDRPAYPHLRREEPFDASEHFLVFEQISTFCRRQASPYGLDKPGFVL